MFTSRRSLLAGVGGVSLGSVVNALQPRQASSGEAALPVASEGGEELVAAAANDALEGAYGQHKGKRRNHTKGFGAVGYFVGTKEAVELSRSGLFAGDRIEVIARFSLAGGDPSASDSERSPRGLGLEFRLKGGALHHMTMIHTPMFYTFRFIDHNERPTNVRWHFVSEDGEKTLTDAQLAQKPQDFLEEALRARLKKGPIRWDMIVTIGEPGDSEDDPTILWPSGRREVRAGTLTLISSSPDQVSGAYNINFDAMLMADGVEPTNDPILRFRSSSYAISHSRRLIEVSSKAQQIERSSLGSRA
jgi:catalase